MHDINDATKVFLSSDGQRKGNDRPAESVLRALERIAKVGMLFIQLGAYHHPRQDEFISIGPGLFRLHFDAFDCVYDDQGTVGNTPRRARVGHKRRITRRVYKSYFSIAVI